ncbi:MAG: hypothetical protein COV08_00975 [Candidatus Vogelbacteria bacterium CG10_big_fil_rev_8_21_14_0_10_49_38]|uniref:Uncharacterized protein n=1 Tax=Candidatus Vogelbacteria bacterium CG10_big_fil_rev_8_21_14_0_10_49_38 TaxID=1975043 RepID=A0A2H0RIE0_9BACT|nr:MAG: hypothetical protein COV08_00975 [Candidatus Vogelbacteria bacterium CG10_big_fil_rev_8_21_14_0_10_49_38]
MRSIKYELKDSYGIAGLRNRIADATISDNKWLYGNINLNDYLEWRSSKTDKQIEDGDRESSLLGFWLEALRLGFVFSKQSHAPNDFNETALQDLFETLDDDLKHVLDRKKWCDFIKIGTPKTNDQGRLKKQIKNLLKGNKREEIEKTLNESDDELKEKINRIADVFAKNKSDKYTIFKLDKPNTEKYPRINDVQVAFFCHPDFEEITERDRTKTLDLIINRFNKRYEITENKKDDKTSNRMALYSLNQGYIPRVLNDLFLFVKDNEDDFSQFLSDLENFFSFSNEQIKIIKERLKKLKKYAEPIPGKPQLADKWDDYASDFGGKLESWYSNRIEKLKKIPESVSDLRNNLEKIRNVLKKQNNASKILELSQKIIEYIRDYGVSFEKPEIIKFSWINKTKDGQKKVFYVAKMADREFIEKLDLWMADLRSQLNEYNQDNKVSFKKKGKKIEELGVLDFALNKAKKNKSTKNENGWQQKLSESIQSAPLFFGEGNRVRNEEVYNLKDLLFSEIKNVENILMSSEAEDLKNIKIEYKEDGAKKGNYVLNVLARFYARFNEDGYGGWNKVKTVLENIAREAGTDFSKYGNNNNRNAGRFYLNGRERQVFTLIKFEKSITVEKILELVKLPSLLDEAYRDLVNENKNHKLRDVIQLSKTIMALVLSHSDKEKQIGGNYIHSKLSGYNALISKRDFISRYSVQTTNGTQCKLAIGKGKSKKGNEIDRYFYAFQFFKNDDSKINLKVIKNNSHKNIDFNDNENKINALQVYSSNYQIQFLDWFFEKHQGKKTSLEVGGSFTIAEKSLTIDWSGSNPRVGFKRSDTEEKRVFVSQPFTLIPDDEDKERRKERMIKTKNRFIGIDIGEYGLAWSLIEVDNGDKNNRGIRQLESGFITDNQQQVLKKNVKSWRQNQIRQTFTSPDTKIARLRESLIGSYKNQLESLMVAKKANLSFEYEVSGFEVGGKRVAKIYDSIKRGSVRKKDNNSQNDQSWGKKGINEWSFETTAAGTSQFCTHCKRWSSLAIVDIEEYELKDYNDNLFKVKINDGEVRLLGKKGWRSGEKIKGKELFGPVKDAMRPNVDGLGMKIVKRKYLKLDLRDWVSRYGNMAIFICPYVDCHHISHADKQAAFNIAVRGYLKSVNPDRAIKHGDKGLSRDFLCQEEGKLNFEQIGLL